MVLRTFQERPKMRFPLSWRRFLLTRGTFTCCVILAVWQSAAAQGHTTAIGDGWRSAPIAVLDSLGATMRWPSLTSFGSKIALTADMIGRTDRPFTRPFAVLLLLPDTRIPLPENVGTGFPKLVTDSQGSIHLFWVDFGREKSTLAAWLAPATVLWHAVWTQHHWSPPERVAAAVSIAWGADAGQLAIDHRGAVHVLTTVLDSARYELVDYRSSGTGWTRSRVAPASLGGSLAVGDGGVMTAVFVASLSSGSPPRMLFSSSVDDGRNWSTPKELLVPVALALTGPPKLPRIVRTRSGLAAAWIESDSAEASSFLVLATRDFSGGWRLARRTPTAGLVARLVMTPGTCAQVNILLEVRARTGGDLESTVLFAQLGSDRRLSTLTPIVRTGTVLEIGATTSHAGLVVAAVVLESSGRVSNRTFYRQRCV